MEPPKLGRALLVCVVLASLAGCRSAPPWIGQGQLVVRKPAAAADPSVLYLEPHTPSPWIMWRVASVEVVSEGTSFQAPITAIFAGDRVRFVNRGPLAHRIFTADPERRIERLVEPDGRSEPLPVMRAGENHFYCSLHPDESLVIFAAPTPFFLVLSGEPDQRIDRIPAGQYQLNEWSESGLRSLGSLEIRAGESTSWEMSRSAR